MVTARDKIMECYLIPQHAKWKVSSHGPVWDMDAENEGPSAVLKYTPRGWSSTRGQSGEEATEVTTLTQCPMGCDGHICKSAGLQAQNFQTALKKGPRTKAVQAY